MKRIVLCLTDEYYGDLTEELGKVDGGGGTRAIGGTQGNKGSHEPMEVRVGDWQHWMPDPWDAAPPSIQSLLPASDNPSGMVFRSIKVECTLNPQRIPKEEMK